MGVCGAALINKASDPSVTWNKSKRISGVEAQLEGVDEVVPMWSSSKSSSTRIFGKENPILDSKKHTVGPISVTVAAEQHEEENEPEADEVADEPAVVKSNPVVEVMDEAAETVMAAVDAAIQNAPDPAERAAASVAEAVVPVEDSLGADLSATLDGPKPAEA